MFYNIIFLIFTLIQLPVYLLKNKFHKGFMARFGVFPKGVKFDRPIWVHAVSVGEALSVRRFLEELRMRFPGRQLVISTVTAAGNKIVRGFAKSEDFVTYLPLDFSFIVKRVVKRINPGMVIIAETEIWPNFIFCLKKNKIPVVVINARISDKSYRGYFCLKPWMKHIFNKVDVFCAQTGTDAKRLMRLGVYPDKIKVTGNIKFDSIIYEVSEEIRNECMGKLGLTAQDKFFVAGSTHPGEEKIILKVYLKLLTMFPGLQLLIAPRHIDRANRIMRLVRKLGFEPVLVSSIIDKENIFLKKEKTVFILDTVGQLVNYYAVAYIVFVGGSLIKKGGHNILEPAALGKPVITGQYMFNFRDIAAMFEREAAFIMVHNQVELAHAFKDLLQNPSKVGSLSKNALALVKGNRGATKRDIDYINERLHL